MTTDTDRAICFKHAVVEALARCKKSLELERDSIPMTEAMLIWDVSTLLRAALEHDDAELARRQ